MLNIFINRKEELKKLVYGLKNGNSYILIAPRRYGKTTLVKKALNTIKEDSKYLVLEVDIMAYSGGSVSTIAEAIIEQCLGAMGTLGKFRQLLRQIDFNFNVKVKYADIELGTAIQLFNTKDKDGEWKLLEYSLELLVKVGKKLNKHVVIFFDEFSELFMLGERAVKLFRSKLQLQDNLSCVFAGSQETLMHKIFVDIKGAFYRFGELVELKELDIEDIESYLIEKLPDIQSESLNACVELLKGHPYYTAVIIDNLIYNYQCGNDIPNMYIHIRDILMQQERSYIELQMLRIKEKKHALEILRIVALGLNPYQEMIHISEQSTYNVLKELEIMGHIKKKRLGEYYLVDPVLEMFLR